MTFDRPMVSEMVGEAVDRYRSALLMAKSVTQVVLLTSASCIVHGVSRIGGFCAQQSC